MSTKYLKKNILELCMSPDLGGLELYMAKASGALKNEFNVFSVITQDSKLSEYFSKDQQVIEFKKSSKFFMLRKSKKLATIIDKNHIDLIHIHWTKDIPLVVLAKLLSKNKPKIVQTRHMTMTRFKNDFYHKFLYKHIDLMIAVTKQVKDQLEKFIPLEVRPKIEVLYGGSDEVVECPPLKLQQNSFNIGMVGRINKDKGQYLLIDAIEILQQKNFDARAYFVGNPMNDAYLDELKQSVVDKKLQDRVEFLGFMKNPYPFYSACDVIVLASKKETFGLVLVEAMKSGTAVIGSNSGGVLEIIQDYKTGLLFEAGEAKSLAHAIERLIEDKQLKAEIIANALEVSNEKFSNRIQFDKLANILKKELSC